MKQFSELGLAEPILRAVLAEGYTIPTPIQSDVIPAMLAGRDIVGIAQTGTGKTAAFVLPLLHRIAAQTKRPEPKCAGALILAPTRELAAQIADSIRTYGKFIRHSVTLVVGGAKPGPQIRAMAQGVDVLVATPGRLLDHMSTGAIRLTGTTTMILDEGDQMLDLGFMPAIRRIMAKLPRDRQTLMLSATMPAQIRGLANDFLKDPLEITVAQVSQPIDRIDQRVIFVESEGKRRALVNLLEGADVERSIVFTRTKRGADRVQTHLERAGLSAAAIHGDKSQPQRERALAAFRAGHVTILVATDIAARGIDVDGISHVVNFELPNVPEAYVHRIGRTARAGKSGIAISLCDGAERKLLRDIERLIGSSFKADGTVVHDGGPPARQAAGPGPRPYVAKARQPRNGPGKGGAPKHRGGFNSGKPAQRRGGRPGGRSAEARA